MACASIISRPLQTPDLALPLPPPRGRKLVVKKVEPSYISSDLFTPFSEPRPTLPSIAEFVRPSYSGDATWGAATTLYGGVGAAAQRFRESGCGSISRSHRHYGSGCVNYPTDLEMGDNSPRLWPLNKMTFETVKRTYQAASEGRATTVERHQVALSDGAASALKDVQSSLYGTSSYNTDFTSVMKAISERRRSSLPPITHYGMARPEMEREASSKDGGEEESLQDGGEEDGETDVDESECHTHSERGHTHLEEERNRVDSIDGNTANHGHMICIPNCVTRLPDHVIITDLSDLPVHFRRVTTKYTRNRCPLFPCRVPYYLQRRHQLLPSAMTSFSSTMTSSTSRGDNRKEGETDPKLSQLIHHCVMESLPHQSASIPHQDQPASIPRQDQPASIPRQDQPASIPRQDQSRLTNARSDDDTEMVAVETGIHHKLKDHVRHSSHVTQCRHSSHVTQHIGLKFKTRAHVRYHALFPDQVPSPQTLEPSKRHTFFGYHASVFRG